MLTLYLLRHAKSTSKDKSVPDFERPLSGRGRKACGLMARFIKEHQIGFDLMLSSTDVSARDTIDLISSHARLQGELRFDERIYEASVAHLLEITSQIESDHKTVLLVGHNPGLEELLHKLTRTSRRLPTAGLAKIKMNIVKWPQDPDGRATLDWIVTPKNEKRSYKRSSKAIQRKWEKQ